MSPPALGLAGLTVDYGRLRALEGIDLAVAPGRICAVLGTNGSGKSTLFKAILGLIAPHSGEVRVHGAPPARARRRGMLAYVPQAEQVDWAFPVRVGDVVLMGRYGHMGPTRRARPADRAAAEQAMRRCGLEELAGRQIGALSGGQRKRAFVARGLAQDAAVFLLDEPFAGVDRASQVAIVAVLRGLREQGRTVLLSTHDLAGVPELCDEAALLQRRILAHGDPATVLAPERLAEVFGATPRPGGAGR